MEKLAGVILAAELSSRMGAFKCPAARFMTSPVDGPGLLMDNDSPHDFSRTLARYQEVCR